MRPPDRQFDHLPDLVLHFRADGNHITDVGANLLHFQMACFTAPLRSSDIFEPWQIVFNEAFGKFLHLINMMKAYNKYGRPSFVL